MILYLLNCQLKSFNSYLTSPCIVSTPHKSQMIPNCYNEYYISSSSIQLAPYEYCVVNNQKHFTLQLDFPRPSVFDLDTDDSNLSFQFSIENTSTKRYRKIFGITTSQLHININFFNGQSTSPFPLPIFYNLKPADKLDGCENMLL